MSAMELRNFEQQLELLSYAEQLSILNFLSKLLQRGYETPEKQQGEDDPSLRQSQSRRIIRPERSMQELLLAFLDERYFEKKDDILAEIATRQDINDGLIDNLAAALDVVIDEGPLDRRFNELRTCVRTRARFENARLR